MNVDYPIISADSHITEAQPGVPAVEDYDSPDFPHSDSTWPWSQELLDKHTADLTEEQTRSILCGNVAGLYGIDTSTLTTTA